ncbi:MAG: insulinase family protein [Phycisphaerae bacterium]|nr:insulinase family protein [Phycisphaerae bacterium]
MNFHEITLDNGLRIIAEVNPAAQSMAAGFFVRTGSRDETPGVAGVSHFLEHMMFKGTAKRSAADVNLEFDNMGANYNAFTSEESTVYYGAVLPEFQDRLMDLLCDMLRPALRQEDFDVEKNVILEEIALYDDQPRFRVYDGLMGHFFHSHPLGQSILGSRQSIGELQRDQMKAYFDARYAADNITVVTVGHVDLDAFVKKVHALCSPWKPSQAGRATPPQPSPVGVKILHDEKIVREHLGLMSPAPTAQADNIHAAQLLAAILGDSTGSRLYYALVEPALVDEASMTYDALDQAGGFMTFLSTDPDRAARVLEIAHTEFRRFMAEGPTDAELAAAKNKLASAATLKGELPMGRLTAVGFDWVYRHEYLPLPQRIEHMFAVTGQQIHELANTFDLTKTACLALGPLENI